jgi:aminoglycoside 3-N-acetyltransferase
MQRREAEFRVQRSGKQTADDRGQMEAYNAESIRGDLVELEVTKGMSLLVHSSLRAIGQVEGGAETVIWALESAVGHNGTIVMPTMTLDLCDPLEEPNLHPPEDQWDAVRRSMPLFDPMLSQTTYMGAIPETFRQQAGVLRSDHPHCSFAAKGVHAQQIVADHGIDNALGETSPMARLYEVSGWVLILGSSKNKNSSIHLAEYRVPEPLRGVKVWDYPAKIVDGQARWETYQDVVNEDEDFDQIHDAFSAETGLVRTGKVGEAFAHLMVQRELVDFSVDWITTNRKIRRIVRFAEP